MSAFVCIFDRSGANLDPADVQRLAEPLAGYGETQSGFCQGPVAGIVLHPEQPDSGSQCGPLADAEGGLLVALAGRLHAIAPSGDSGAISDRATASGAALALEALRRQDTGFLAATAGSFVLIAAEPGQRRLSLWRDHLGDLKVYYHLDRRWLIAASEPEPILRHPAVDDDLDERAAVRFLGFRFSHTERSFFRQIKELPPAYRLLVTASDSQRDRYWHLAIQPDEVPHDEVCAGFRREIERSISLQLGGLEPPQVGLSLSGGLDSTTLAALAPPAVQKFSWYFEQLTECDERPNIEAVARDLEMRVHWVPGDGLHPLSGDYIERFVHANSPHLNAFAALKQRLYYAARAAGCRQIMVGDSGDALYAAQEYWLRDLLADKGPRILPILLRTMGRAVRGDRLSRLALRRLLPLTGVRQALGRRPLPWLTDLAYSRLPPKALSPVLPSAHEPRRYDLCVGAKNTELESEERRLFAQCGVARSNPFWFWPLLERVLRLPAWWYHRDGVSKVLTRESMRGRLPEAVLRDGKTGLLGAFFLRGIQARRSDIRRQVFLQPRSDWQRYVRREWLEPYLDNTASIQFGHTILWRVISYELWQRRLIRIG